MATDAERIVPNRTETTFSIPYVLDLSEKMLARNNNDPRLVQRVDVVREALEAGKGSTGGYVLYLTEGEIECLLEPSVEPYTLDLTTPPDLFINQTETPIN
jgi:hypothetical protein